MARHYFRSRCQLHFSKIEEFISFCEAEGYTREKPITDVCEVLRLTKKGRVPIIAHKRDRATQHVTTWGESERMFLKFQRSKQVAPPAIETTP